LHRYTNRFELRRTDIFLGCNLGQREGLRVISLKVDTNYFKGIKKKLVYLSDNDDLVPPKLTIELAKEIDAPYITVPNGGHFLGREGYTKFQQLVDSLKEMLDSK
jgi:predicted alpha/beta hydrolase family esterase